MSERQNYFVSGRSYLELQRRVQEMDATKWSKAGNWFLVAGGDNEPTWKQEMIRTDPLATRDESTMG